MEVSDQFHASAALPLEKKQNPLYKRMGQPRSRSGRYGEERNFLHLSGIEPRFLTVQPVALSVPTELTQLPVLYRTTYIIIVFRI
jgi:hypothetical protein